MAGGRGRYDSAEMGEIKGWFKQHLKVQAYSELGMSVASIANVACPSPRSEVGQAHCGGVIPLVSVEQLQIAVSQFIEILHIAMLPKEASRAPAWAAKLGGTALMLGFIVQGELLLCSLGDASTMVCEEKALSLVPYGAGPHISDAPQFTRLSLLPDQGMRAVLGNRGFWNSGLLPGNVSFRAYEDLGRSLDETVDALAYDAFRERVVGDHAAPAKVILAEEVRVMVMDCPAAPIAAAATQIRFGGIFNGVGDLGSVRECFMGLMFQSIWPQFLVSALTDSTGSYIDASTQTLAANWSDMVLRSITKSPDRVSACAAIEAPAVPMVSARQLIDSLKKYGELLLRYIGSDHEKVALQKLTVIFMLIKQLQEDKKEDARATCERYLAGKMDKPGDFSKHLKAVHAFCSTSASAVAAVQDEDCAMGPASCSK